MKDNMYDDALAVQSACNLSGVVKALAGHMEKVWEEAREKGEGTDWVNAHPVVILFVEQIYHLSRGKAYSEAYIECREKAVRPDFW